MAKIEQYAYFCVYSDKVQPEAITKIVGLEPNETALAGAKRRTPMLIPRQNMWKVTSGVSAKNRLDDHFASLFARLSPYAEQIRDLVTNGDVTAALVVVRHIEPGSEVPEVLKENEQEGLTRLRGQHPLVGFYLEPSLIKFLSHTGCSLDVDEYCDEYE
jgi:hypothetical protein